MHPDGTGALKKTASSRLESHQEGGQKNHLLAQDAGTAIAFRLSPGNCHAAPKGEAWLKGIDCPFPGCPMIMDRADEGDTTRQLAVDLMFSAVVPPKSNGLDPWEYDQEQYKREMKWNDCSAG